MGNMIRKPADEGRDESGLLIAQIKILDCSETSFN